MAGKAEFAVEVTGVSLANKMMTGGGIAGVVAFVGSINWLGLVGAFAALGGLAVSAYFQWRKNRREEAAELRAKEAELRAKELHSAQLAALLRDRCES